MKRKKKWDDDPRVRPVQVRVESLTRHYINSLSPIVITEHAANRLWPSVTSQLNSDVMNVLSESDVGHCGKESKSNPLLQGKDVERDALALAAKLEEERPQWRVLSNAQSTLDVPELDSQSQSSVTVEKRKMTEMISFSKKVSKRTLQGETINFPTAEMSLNGESQSDLKELQTSTSTLERKGDPRSKDKKEGREKKESLTSSKDDSIVVSKNKRKTSGQSKSLNQAEASIKSTKKSSRLLNPFFRPKDKSQLPHMGHPLKSSSKVAFAPRKAHEDVAVTSGRDFGASITTEKTSFKTPLKCSEQSSNSNRSDFLGRHQGKESKHSKGTKHQKVAKDRLQEQNVAAISTSKVFSKESDSTPQCAPNQIRATTSHKKIRHSKGTEAIHSVKPKPQVGDSLFDQALTVKRLPLIPRKKRRQSTDNQSKRDITVNANKTDSTREAANTADSSTSGERCSNQDAGQAQEKTGLSLPVAVQNIQKDGNSVRNARTDEDTDNAETPVPSSVASESEASSGMTEVVNKPTENSEKDGSSLQKVIAFADLCKRKVALNEAAAKEEGELSDDSEEDNDIVVVEVVSSPKANSSNKRKQPHTDKTKKGGLRVIESASKTNAENIIEKTSSTVQETSQCTKQSESSLCSISASVSKQHTRQQKKQNKERGEDEELEDVLELHFDSEEMRFFDESESFSEESQAEVENDANTAHREAPHSGTASTASVNQVSHARTEAQIETPIAPCLAEVPIPHPSLSESQSRCIMELHSENLCLTKLEFNTCPEQPHLSRNGKRIGSCSKNHHIRPCHVIGFFELIRDSFNEALPADLQAPIFTQRVKRLMGIYNSHKNGLKHDVVAFIRLVTEVARCVRTFEPNRDFCWYMEQCVRDLVTRFPHGRQASEVEDLLAIVCQEIVTTFDVLPDHLKPSAATSVHDIFVMAVNNDVVLSGSAYEIIAMFAAKNPDTFVASISLCQLSSMPFFSLKPKVVFAFLNQYKKSQIPVKDLANVIPILMTLSTSDLKNIQPQALQRVIFSVDQSARSEKQFFAQVGAPFILRLLKLKLSGVIVDENCVRSFVYCDTLEEELTNALAVNNHDFVASRLYDCYQQHNYSMLRAFNIALFETLTLDDDIGKLSFNFHSILKGVIAKAGNLPKMLKLFIQQLAATLVVHVALDNDVSPDPLSFIDFLLTDFNNIEIFTPFVPESVSNALKHDRRSPYELKCFLLQVMADQGYHEQAQNVLIQLPQGETKLWKAQPLLDLTRTVFESRLSELATKHPVISQYHTDVLSSLIYVYNTALLPLLGAPQHQTAAASSETKESVSRDLYSLLVIKLVELRIGCPDDSDQCHRLEALLNSFTTEQSHHCMPSWACIRAMVYLYGSLKQLENAGEVFKNGMGGINVYELPYEVIPPRSLRVANHLTIVEMKALISVFLPELRDNLTGPELARLLKDLEGAILEVSVRAESRAVTHTGISVIDELAKSSENEALDRFRIALNYFNLGLVKKAQGFILDPSKLCTYLKRMTETRECVRAQM